MRGKGRLQTAGNKGGGSRGREYASTRETRERELVRRKDHGGKQAGPHTRSRVVREGVKEKNVRPDRTRPWDEVELGKTGHTITQGNRARYAAANTVKPRGRLKMDLLEPTVLSFGSWPEEELRRAWRWIGRWESTPEDPAACEAFLKRFGFAAEDVARLMNVRGKGGPRA